MKLMVVASQAIYWINANQQNVNNTSFSIMKLAR